MLAASVITVGGVFTWTPSETQGPGVYTFDVVVMDDVFAEDRETIVVTVTEGNTAPVLVLPGLPSNVDEMVLWSFTATATDVDVPVSSLAFSLSFIPNILSLSDGGTNKMYRIIITVIIATSAAAPPALSCPLFVSIPLQ